MGDYNEVGEVFQALKKQRRVKRAENRDSSPKVLNAANIEFTSHNEGRHLRVKKGGDWVDFWPGTGLWIHGAKKGRGVFGLLKYIQGVDDGGDGRR